MICNHCKRPKGLTIGWCFIPSGVKVLLRVNQEWIHSQPNCGGPCRIGIELDDSSVVYHNVQMVKLLGESSMEYTHSPKRGVWIQTEDGAYFLP